MKIAICFDDLIQFGGAERLLLAVHELYPNAPIYTSLASDEWLKRCADLHINLKTSCMQKLPFKKPLNRFYGLLGLHALAFESFKFDDFDIVLSISARFAHVIITKPGTIHVCYMNSPGRMFWESHDYFEREGFLRNNFMKRLFSIFGAPMLSINKFCDYASAQRVDYFIANALTPKERIKKYYRRDSTVIHPFVERVIGWDANTRVIGRDERLQAEAIPSRLLHFVRNDGVALVPPNDGRRSRNDDYFLVITRLNAWKRVDIAIDACKIAGVNLKIIGEGPDKERLLRFARNDGVALVPPNDDSGQGMPACGRCRMTPLVPPNDDSGQGMPACGRCRMTPLVPPNDAPLVRGDGGIEFLGFVSDQEKISAILGCKALIVTQKEDFGITALEAMSLGKPVIAYRAGGALETVVDGVTGEFFDMQDADSLATTLQHFNPSIYKPEACKNQAGKFSKQKFMHKLDEFVKKVYDEHHNL